VVNENRPHPVAVAAAPSSNETAAQPTVRLEHFLRAYDSFRPKPDPDSLVGIETAADQGLFIVAGPGTGKTTCLTLRILKLILVDGLRPGRIVATTFTVKAAAELRSRILGWGFRLTDALRVDESLSSEVRDSISRIDVQNLFSTRNISSMSGRPAAVKRYE
jgi:ATP-dependent DNA helicase UvrD/PcrA